MDFLIHGLAVNDAIASSRHLLSMGFLWTGLPVLTPDGVAYTYVSTPIHSQETGHPPISPQRCPEGRAADPSMAA